MATNNETKIINGVAAEVIEQHGAVSQATATAMAQAIRKRLGADFGIGIAGVDTPSPQEEKPVGLAYVGIAGPNGTKEMELRVPPRRITVKRRISNTALIELYKLLAADGGVDQSYEDRTKA